MLRLVCIFVLSLLASACARETGDAYLENYLDRLGNVLDKTPEDYMPATVAPKLTYHQWGVSGRLTGAASSEKQSISILDFLSLYGCDLQMVVAEGNSSLGKFAPASQVLLRNLRFLHYTPACVENLNPQDDAELIEQLRKEQLAKKQQLPSLIWRVIFNDAEAKQFWRSPHSLADYPGQVSIDPELSVSRLGVLAEGWLKGNHLEGVNELERLLGDLRTGDGGALIKAYSLLNQQLTIANKMLEAYIAEEQCVRGLPTIDTTILQNVVEKFFVGEVQVWAADLNRRVYSLVHAYQGLEARFAEVETEAYRDWRTARDEYFESSIGATAEHVGLLQKAMHFCSEFKER